ncbi:unnamed protein product [Paramecium sonneborni]|uniref:Nudix hydrolase domain-containing protein n=1 Tax=Paramecium sonneborni TaxID=65129 RepID=A0A8S1R2B8_9CILI|nr:unnamed protein product [Paramecium sonneborni]
MMRPGLGVGVFIKNGDSVLMSYRKDNGYLALPGGHLELYEEFEDCAIREVKEETNLDIENPQIFQMVNVVKKEIDHHFVVVFLTADYNEKSQLMNVEPNKHNDWKWINAQSFQQHYNQKQLFFGLMKLVDRFGNAETLFNLIFNK